VRREQLEIVEHENHVPRRDKHAVAHGKKASGKILYTFDFSVVVVVAFGELLRSHVISFAPRADISCGSLFYYEKQSSASTDGELNMFYSILKQTNGKDRATGKRGEEASKRPCLALPWLELEHGISISAPLYVH
jgi:hypothetical protein